MINNYLKLLLIFIHINGIATAQDIRGLKKTTSSLSDTGTTYGIVVGISSYQNLPSLKYADKDAENFYRYLITGSNKTTDSKNIYLFTNQEAKRDDIAEKLYEINDKVVSGDKVYFYFGGHGDIEHLTQTDNGLLLLTESPQKNYLRKSNSYLDINLFKDFFQSWSAKGVKTIFICDACHSGSLLSGGEAGKKNTLLSLQQSWSNETKMLSCQPDEFSLEGHQWGGGRGLFSYYLVAGLQGMADKNKDSLVTLFELQKFVQDSVSTYSEQTQIPALGGDVKSVLNKYNLAMYADAKKSINWKKLSSPADNLIALKGNEEENIIATLKDTNSIRQFKQFRQYIKSDIILSPQNACAIAVYKQFAENETTRIARGYMKLILTNILQAGFDEMMTYLYDDKFEEFDFIKRFQIEKNNTACLSIIGTNHYLYNKLKARQLFLQACNAASGIQTGAPITASLVEKLTDGIELLNKGVQLDPLAPFLYLRLGDYYLFSNRFAEAISSYNTYQQLLPNDEYALNKLGMAYFYSRSYQKAIECFTRALKINPRFHKAQSNLEIAKNKAGL